MDPADDPRIPDHAVWCMHIAEDMHKLMMWGMSTPDDQANRGELLKFMAERFIEVADAFKEIAAGGNRAAMEDRVRAALKYTEKGFGGVDLGDLPQL